MKANQYIYFAELPLKTRILNEFRKLFRNKAVEDFIIGKLIRNNNQTSWSKLVPPEYLYKKGSWRNYDRGGIKLRLDLSNLVDHSKYFNHQDNSFGKILSRVSAGDTIIDIGANIGMTAIEFAKRAKQGRVICYEPSLENFRRLSDNLALNKFSNTEVNNLGIGSKAATIKLYNPVEANSGMKRAVTTVVDDADRYEDVVIDTLDNQVATKGISQVNVIKIDVEGYELEVLRGAHNTLSAHHPFLFIELVDNNLAEQGASAREVVELLLSYKYNITNAATGQVITMDSNLAGCSFDILCV